MAIEKEVIGEAFIALKASFDEFRKEMDLIKKEVEKSVSPIQKQFKDIGKSVGNAGKDLTKFVTGPIAAAGGGLMLLASKTAAAGDAIQKMAQRTGFSTEALSEYKHAAELSGTSLEAIETSVKRMQRTLLDAEQGLKTATDSLDALGLSVQDLQGLSPEQQFDILSTAIANVEDASRRAALAQEIFGRSGTELLPMLAAGADGIALMRQEARDLGLVFDQEAADAAARFNDDMDRLKKAFSGVFMEVGKNLLPVLTEQLIPVIRDNIIPIVKDFAEKLSGLIKWFAELDPKWQKVILAALGFAAALGPLLVVVGNVITGVGTLIGFLPVLKVAFAALTGPIGLVIAAVASFASLAYVVYKNWEQFKDTFSALWDVIKLRFDNAIAGIGTGWNKLKEVVYNVIQRILDAISPLIEWLPGRLGESFETMRQTINEKLNDVGNNIDTLSSRTEQNRAKMEEALNTLKQLGRPEAGYSRYIQPN